MTDKRRKDVVWHVADDSGATRSWDEVQIAVLMDLRDELKRLNSLLHCHNFKMLPHTLEKIQTNTTRPGPSKLKQNLRWLLREAKYFWRQVMAQGT